MKQFAKKLVLLGHRYRHKLVGNLDMRWGMCSLTRRKWLRYSTFKPNLVMVGAQKAGTTSLATYLSHHPDIHLSRPLKEPGYLMFSPFMVEYWQKQGKDYPTRDLLLRRGMLEGYRWQRYFLDASTHYTLGEHEKNFGISAKLQKDTKLLYLVRNPFDRMLSAYRHAMRSKTIDFKEFIRQPGVHRTTSYHDQIVPYVEAVGIENVLLLLSEEFYAAPQKTLDAVCNFLDIECFTPACGFPVLNASKRNDVKYPVDIFRDLKPNVDNVISDIEALFNLKTNWDTSETRWVDGGDSSVWAAQG